MQIQQWVMRSVAAAVLGVSALGAAQAQSTPATLPLDNLPGVGVFVFGGDKTAAHEFGISFMSNHPVATPYTLDSWTYYAASGQAGDVEMVVTEWDAVNGQAVGNALFRQTYAYNGGNGPLATFSNMGVQIYGNVNYLVYVTAKGTNAATAPGVVEVPTGAYYNLPLPGTWISTLGDPLTQTNLVIPMYSATFLAPSTVTSPVPEPGTYALVAAGLLTCAALQRRRRQA